MRSEAEQQMRFTRRALLLGAGQAAVGLALVGRMGWLTVKDGDKYKLAAEQNRVALRLIAPRRGWIVDRFGKPLAYNRPDYRLELTPDDTPDLEGTLAAINRIVPLAPEEMARIRQAAENQPGYIPIAILEDLPWEVFAAVNVRLPELPGVAPVRGFSRAYANGAAYAHLLGYVAKPGPAEYARTKDKLLLLPGFKVGKDGVERILDERLRGKPGAKREVVTAKGRPVRTLTSLPDTPGETVKLTINRDLQDFIARRIGPQSASVVVMDVLTGDILAQVSLPAFDPNVFSVKVGRDQWAALQADDKHPLLNKTINAAYPPGSTFKPMTSLAILESGIDPKAGIVCRGGYSFGGHVFHCHLRRGHGRVDLVPGLTKSCDVYFYHFGRLAGMDAIARAAKQFGLGGKFELPMPSQRSGIVPSPAWKEERYHKAWLPGETLSCAIGQGYVLANPLQLAVMTARVASGLQVQPRLIVEGNQPGFAPMALPPDYLGLVRQGMEAVVNGAGGTAHRAKLKIDVRMAGKTGTAQVIGMNGGKRRSESATPWKFRDHALFVCYAPADNPRYAVSIIVEHGGHGGTVCAPIAADAITFLYDQDVAMANLARAEEGFAEQTRKEAARLKALERAQEAARAAAAAQAADPAAAAATANAPRAAIRT
jgi:penicillin-binding protein 2